MGEKRRSYGPEIGEKIIELRKQGLKREDVAKALDIPLTKVHKFLQKNKVVQTKEQRSANYRDGRSKTAAVFPEGTTERILELHRSGKGRLAISTELGIDINKVISDIQRFSDYLLSREENANARRTFSLEDRERVIFLRKNGWSTERITEETGLSASTIRYFCSDAGVTLTSEQKSNNSPVAIYRGELKEEVISLRNSGTSLSEITNKLDLKRGGLKSFLYRSGITVSAEHRSRNAIFGKNPDLVWINEEIVGKIITLRSEGKKTKQIAEGLGLTQPQVASVLVENGVTLTREQRRTNSERESRYRWKDVSNVAVESGLELVGNYDLSATIPSRVKKFKFKCVCGRIQDAALYTFLYKNIRSCGCIKSRPQMEIASWIESLGFVVQTNVRSIITPYELDIVISSEKVAIEYCGIHWHGEKVAPAKGKDRHLNKLKEAESEGYRLVTIFSDEWLMKSDAVKAYLSAILGVSLQCIGAWDTELKSGPMTNVAGFLKENHIQGSSGTKAYYLSHKNETVAAMTVRPARGSTDNTWEITRYCVKGGVAVPGGFERLLKEATRILQPKAFVTYADRRWSQGGLYRRNGFTHSHNLPPSYWYFKSGTDLPRHHKSKYRLDKIRDWPEAAGSEPKTEWEIMQAAGYSRIWDCGVQVWRLDLK